ncbi:MAG: hypothetical protein LUC93_05565 [Planctomycetaceae bacterium]|nr:hypothetical protein [Planctomycetaceae bacterium]
MEGKHTPGPWKLWDELHPDGDERRPNVVVMPEVADQGSGNKYACVGGGNIDANARLISAAPDLLEACEVAFRAVTSKPTTEKWMNMIDVLRAAIAKAKGEG